MALSATRGSRRTPACWFRLVMLAAGLSAVLPASSAAQDVDQRRYLAAESDYSAALSARDLERALYEDAMAEAHEARDSGDQGRHGRALAVFQDRALQLELRNRLLAEARDELEQARRAYLESVYARQDELYEELTRTADERDRTLMLREIAMLDDDANRLTRSVDILDDPFPEINIAPGDTPDDIRAKADLLERQAARHDGLLVDIQAQIELHERRLRHARMAQDFGADLSRFDDLRVPVGTPDAASEQSEGLTGPEELSQRLEELNRSREFLIERRDVALARAEEFRQRIGDARV